jgi:benzoylsuccinyl-CoA thiolase BbsB subunit
MTLGERVLDQVGIAGIPTINVENACASSSTALNMAWLSVAAGQHDAVLVIGAEKMRPGLLPLTQLTEGDLEALVGKTIPSLSALMASRYAVDFGITPQDLAAVAVKNSRRAAKNPYAHHRSVLTTEEILHAPMISAPLTRLMCCPTSDGAAAALVVSDKLAKANGARSIRIASSSIVGGTCIGRKDMPNATARAAHAAYEAAGIDPADVDVAEGLDYTSMAEILLYEDLGLVGKGEGVKAIRDERDGRTAHFVFSPGGGLLRRGHPLGATGIAQVVEIVWQLRGEAGERQVPGAKIGLTHAAGGVITGVDDEGLVTVHLLQK